MDTRPAPESPGRFGWFWQMAPWKKGLVILGSLMALLVVATLVTAMLARSPRQTVINSLAAGRASSPGPATWGFRDGRSVFTAERAPVPAKEAPTAMPAREAASYGSLETWGRQLILTGAIALEVPDVRDAYDRIQLLAEREGALVTNASLKATSGEEDGGYGRATLVLRVPQGRFHEVRQRLLGLAGDLKAKVLSDEVSSEDVTEEYVDLQARLRHWQAEETQLLETMRRAHQIRDILAVRDKLAAVRQETERINGRLRFLQSRVDLSTITVEIYQKGKAPAEPTIQANLRTAGRAIAGAFKKALVDVVFVLGWIGTVITYLLPFALIIALIWAALRAARRKAPSGAPGA